MKFEHIKVVHLIRISREAHKNRKLLKPDYSLVILSQESVFWVSGSGEITRRTMSVRLVTKGIGGSRGISQSWCPHPELSCAFSGVQSFFLQVPSRQGLGRQ
jgi:hypothetical protein